MSADSDQPLIAALDIGSSKVSALIVTRDPDGRLRVLGTGQRESRGVKRGYVTDMEASEVAVREAVEIAERMSGVTIDDVWASFAAGGLVSDIANVEVELGGHQVEQSDIDELLSPGRARSTATARSCSMPIRRFTPSTAWRECSIRSGCTPTGSASTSMSSPPTRRRLRNIDYVIRSAHLGVRAIVASPVAAALACLTPEERELGVALVELGAEVTNVSLHAGGMLVGLRSIPLGAKDITDDIACAFAVQRREAERMKCRFGSAMTSPRDNHEMVEATPIGGDDGGEPLRITHAQLITVIRQRTEQITNEIERALKELGFSGPVGRQVVLTGGGAELKNIADYMQGVLGRAVRVGRPKTITGPARSAQRPGLLHLGRAGAARCERKRRHPRPCAGRRARQEAGDGHARPTDLGDEGRVLVRALS